MNATTLLIAALFVASTALSFLMSGMEAGVLALSRLRIRQQMRAGRHSARVLHGFLENPENFLWTILVGNTLANFVTFGLAFAWLDGLVGHHDGGLLAALGAVFFLFYTFCDLLPKMLFRIYPNRLCLALAPPFRLVHLGLQPFVATVEWFSGFLLRWTGGKTFTGHLFGNREELKFLMRESAQSFSTEEQAMISRVLDLQTLTVRQIATPLAQALTVGLETPMNDVFVVCRERQVTRLPVWETKDAQRRIVGILDLEPIIYRADVDAAKRAGDFVKPALYLDEDLRLELALQRLQRGGHRLAIVLGRDRREAGIVSLEDILKVIFGEMKL